MALMLVYSHWAHGEEPKVALLLLIGIASAIAGAVCGVLLVRRGATGGWPATALNAAAGVGLLQLFRLL
jgi:hypothetical protein